MLETTGLLLAWPEERAFSKAELCQQIDEHMFRGSLADLRTFKWLKERGYGDVFLARPPSLRKYFAVFLHLPCAAEQGNDSLLHAIDIIRQLDAGTLKRVPPTMPAGFVPRELRRALKDQTGQINRNAWETGLALVIKDALRSGDLYLPKSKQYVSLLGVNAQRTMLADGAGMSHMCQGLATIRHQTVEMPCLLSPTGYRSVCLQRRRAGSQATD